MTTLPGWRISSRKPGALEDCSLVVPAAHRHTEVLRLLDTLLTVPDAPAEVVVVDGDPSRELGGILRAWARDIHTSFDLVYVESPPGLTRQRNVGVDISSRRLIFFLDDATVPLAGFFYETRRVFQTDRERCVGGIAGCMVNAMDPAAARRWKLGVALRLIQRGSPLIYHRSGVYTPHTLMPPFSGVRRVDVLPGCASAFRREVFDRDRFSCFFHDYPRGEDLEISLRIGKRWTLLCCGDARALQFPGSHRDSLSYARGRAEMRNRYFVWKRHTPDPGKRHIAAFWAETVFLGLTALASLRGEPWNLRLGYALGMLVESARCLSRTPRFEEPPARREYVLTAAADHELAARRAE